MIKEQRKTAKLLLLLDAGDALIRERAPAVTSQGQTSVELMNMLGYDAMALGEGDLRILGVTVVQQRIKEAKFPVLSANAVLTRTNKLVAEPYVILKRDGHRIAIVGLTGAEALPDVEIRDPLASARQAVAQVGDRADVVILLSHAGLGVNREIARQVPQIDLIISGGGSQSSADPEVTSDGVVIVQADLSSPGHAGRQIGVGTWYLAQGRIQTGTWQSLPLTPQIPGDPDMEAWVQKHM